MDDYCAVLSDGKVRHEYLFVGGPIEKLDPETVVLFLALGRAGAAWARLEQHLDALLMHVNKIANSRDLYAEHPVSFRPKVRLLKRWFNRHPSLAELRDSFRELSSKLRTLADSRNIYLHSVLENWDRDTKIATFHALKSTSGDNFTSTIYDIPLDQIATFTDLVLLTNRFLAAISDHIFTPEMTARLQTP